MTFCDHLELSIAGTAMFNVVFNPVQKGETSQVLNSLGLTFHLILGTNVLSIGLIAWKSWCALLASNP